MVTTGVRKPRGHFSQICSGEREIIRRMLAQKYRMTAIARVVGKHQSTLWRELRRNVNAGGQYYELHAEASRQRRRISARTKFLRVENDLSLEAYIERLLKYGLSPEQIAGYMRRSHHRAPISYRTIHRWVHRKWQSRKALLRFAGNPPLWPANINGCKGILPTGFIEIKNCPFLQFLYQNKPEIVTIFYFLIEIIFGLVSKIAVRVCSSRTIFQL